jgi:hypothetical protein
MAEKTVFLRALWMDFWRYFSGVGAPARAILYMGRSADFTPSL